MTTIKTHKPEFPEHWLDAILANDSFTTDNLELLGALISRAMDTSKELQFQNQSGVITDLKMANTLMFERGIDIR